MKMDPKTGANTQGHILVSVETDKKASDDDMECAGLLCKLHTVLLILYNSTSYIAPLALSGAIVCIILTLNFNCMEILWKY